ncbi:FMN-binding glutamate synthase family protein [Aquicoccus sp. SCR17]|nr:FMN-binding glutamate synthase family protein [Carideicomes alvinocaridis]
MLRIPIRFVPPIVAILILALGLALAWLSPWWLILAALALPFVAIGFYDFFQTRWTLTRNYPISARIRWLFYDLRPYLRQYIVEGDLEGQPYSFEARNLVYARARGQSDTHPFGTEREVSAAGYDWMSHSMNPTEKAEESPRIKIGNEQCARPYSASMLNISAMSFGSLSARAVQALNLGAEKGGFFHDTGEGGLSRHHLAHDGDIVWEIGSGYFGCRDDAGRFDAGAFREKAQIDQVKMVEIKLSQGAKPGHGGMLPAAKVTQEIAEARQVPAHQDCLSPNGHSAFSTPVEMLEFAASLREMSGGKPVGLKFCVGQPHGVFALVKAIRKTGICPDFLVVDGAEGGTGAAPQELSDHVGWPLNEGLNLVRNALVGTGLKDRVMLGASGKVYSGAGMARNLALGADWCNAARAFMFSIGCIQAQRCHTGTCPTGITTQDAWRQRGLVVEVQAERAARFHAKTLDALGEIIAALGLDHPREIEPHHLMQRPSPVEARGLGTLYGWVEKNALLDAPEDTVFAPWWEAADPDSFRPRTDLSSSAVVSQKTGRSV